MKQFILLLFVLTTTNICAQNIGKCHSPRECMSITDTLISLTSRNYQIVDTLTSRRTGYGYFIVTCKDDQRLFQCTFKYTASGNVALEQQGAITYILYAVNGAYLDVFPIWKKYIDKTADVTSMSTKLGGGRAEIVTDNNVSKYKFTQDANNPSYWTLQKYF